jgi:predicted nucleic-acid-binding protein
MIGFDTNILVRFFTQDNPRQCEQTDELMRSLSVAKPAWIGMVTLLEFVWVLTRIYRIGQHEMVRILDDLLDRPEIVVERIDTVHEALNLYRAGKADFADCLIVASARDAGCDRVLTFDRIAARDAGMELPE